MSTSVIHLEEPNTLARQNQYLHLKWEVQRKLPRSTFELLQDWQNQPKTFEYLGASLLSGQSMKYKPRRVSPVTVSSHPSLRPEPAQQI
jgi:hypothetical protein